MRSKPLQIAAWVALGLFFVGGFVTPLAIIYFRGSGSGDRVERPADLEGKAGQVVELSGTVQGYGESGNEPAVMLQWGSGTTVVCVFPASAEWIKATGPGERLTVRGTVSSLQPGMVFLDGCQRVKSR